MQQTALELDVGHRFTERVLGFVGLRHNDINADVQVDTTGPRSGVTRAAGTGESWVNHMIGTYRCVHMNFASGSGPDLFKYDMAIHGPRVGVAYRS
jgi:hypothetical protein